LIKDCDYAGAGGTLVGVEASTPCALLACACNLIRNKANSPARSASVCRACHLNCTSAKNNLLAACRRQDLKFNSSNPRAANFKIAPLVHSRGGEQSRAAGASHFSSQTTAVNGESLPAACLTRRSCDTRRMPATTSTALGGCESRRSCHSLPQISLVLCGTSAARAPD
jgi:hypothetical protein